MEDALGGDVRMQIVIGQDRQDTPARRQEAQRLSAQEQAEAAIENDATVTQLRQDFGARIIPGSVQPKRSNGE